MLNAKELIQKTYAPSLCAERTAAREMSRKMEGRQPTALREVYRRHDEARRNIMSVRRT